MKKAKEEGIYRGWMSPYLALDKATRGFSIVMLIKSYRFIKTVDVNFKIHRAARKWFYAILLWNETSFQSFPIVADTNHHRPLLHLTSQFRKTFEANSRRFQEILLYSEISFAF